MERCARGLHKRKRRSAIEHNQSSIDASGEDQQSIDQMPSIVGVSQPTDTELTNDASFASATTFIQDHTFHQNESLEIDEATTLDQSRNSYQERQLSTLDDVQPQAILPEPEPVLSPAASSSRLASSGIPNHVAMSHISAFFRHFQPFLPVIHRPTFSLTASEWPLVSVVIAIGSMYSTSHADTTGTGKDTIDGMWSKSRQNLEDHVSFFCVMNSINSANQK